MARVETLIEMLQEQGWALTITVSNGRANFGVIGNPDPKAVLDALAMVRDTIITQVTKQAEQTAQAPFEGVDIPEEATGEPVPDTPIDGEI